MSLIEKILTEWSYRVHNGMPNPKNPLHLVELRESLNELKIPRKVTEKLLQNLRELDIVKNKKSGNTYTVKSHNKKTQDLIKKDASQSDIDKIKKQDKKEKETDKPEIETIPPQRLYKNESEFDFENDTIEDIAEKTAKAEFVPTTTEQTVDRAKDDRIEVFSLRRVGKGGKKTTIQEEMGNMAKDIGFVNPDASDQETEDEIFNSIKNTESVNKYGEEEIRRLIKASLGGKKTAQIIMTDKSFDYNKKQPDGHPVTTSESNIARDALLTKLDEAKKSGDKKAIEHYQKELEWFQKKASSKAITGTEGDADTMVMYYDSQNNLRVAYVTNKQGEGDVISNSTIDTVTMATEASALPDSDVQSVVRVQRDAAEKAKGFNEKYVTDTQEIIKNNRQDLKDIGNVLGKLVLGHADRSEYNDYKANIKQLNDNLKNKTVRENLKKMGVDLEKADKDPEEYAQQIIQAGLDSHGTGVTGIGTGAQGVAYGTVKVAKQTAKVRGLVKDALKKNREAREKDPSIPELTLTEACKDVSKRVGSNGKPLFGGVLKPDDIESIYNNKGLEELEKRTRDRQDSMKNLHEQSINRLREVDIQYYMDRDGLSEEDAIKKMETEPGPNEKSYTAGFLHRTHLDDYIMGAVDGRVLGEMGTNSHSPKRIRQALVNLLEYPGSIDIPPPENGEKFREYVLNNVRPGTTTENPDNQNLTYINKDGKEISIGLDDHRLAGRNEKMAGHFGKEFQDELQRLAKEDK